MCHLFMYVICFLSLEPWSLSHQESSQSGNSDNTSLLSSYVSIPSITDSMEFDTTNKFKEIQASLAKLDAVSTSIRMYIV